MTDTDSDTARVSVAEIEELEHRPPKVRNRGGASSLLDPKILRPAILDSL